MTSLRNIQQDLRHTFRQLRNAPVWALTAVLTLALGLGANTAIFSLFDQALLRALPVPDPGQLVVLRGTGKAWQGHIGNHGGAEEAYFSYPMYRDLRDRNQAFAGLAATAPADIAVTRAGVAEHQQAELVSGNYFAVLGIRPALGRVFSQADDKAPGANHVAVLSFAYWHDHLGGDPGTVGRTVLINAQPIEVVGVAAPGFRSAVWGQAPSVFVPMSMLGVIVPGKGGRLQDHTDRWLNILGRMRPGFTARRTQAALAPLWHGLRADELKVLGTRPPEFVREFLTDSRLLAEPGARGFSYDRESLEQPLEAAMAMALLVLAMAGVNVGSLLLVRSAARSRELSLRAALGAPTGQLAGQLLLEGLLLGAAGCAAALLVAPMATRALVGFLKGDQAFSDFTASFDARLVGFNCAAALAVSLLFSLAPMLGLRRLNLSMAMRSTAGAGGPLRLRRAVVLAQITLSVLLLAGAGLFVRTVQKLRAADPGFQTARLLTFAVNPALAGYAPAAIPPLYDLISGSLATLPGVVGVGATDDPELADHSQTANITVSGFTPKADEDVDVERAVVSPGFFAALGIPLAHGRGLLPEDTVGHPRIAVVNRSFARHFCGGDAGCIGRRIGLGDGKNIQLDTEIVGIVGDVKHEHIQDAVAPAMYMPLKQAEKPGRMFFYIRTYAAPESTLAGAAHAVNRIDPALAVVGLRTMSAQVDDLLSNERTLAVLAGAFGALAAVLAGVGIYGVLAYTAAQRTREIGIRLALGSPRSLIAGLVLGDVLRLAGLGIAVALPLAWGASRLLRSLLYGVSPTDPTSLLAAILLVVAVALLAAALPARRAASVDPVVALRSE